MTRLRSFDIARGFTVLFMPAIHVVMLFSTTEVKLSWVGYILGLIAEGPGAQLFMLLMGIGITLSRNTSERYAFKRYFYLLLAGYALNAAKFVLPLLLGLLPAAFLHDLRVLSDYHAVPFFFLMGDILQFAAAAYILCFILYQFEHYHYWAAILIIFIVFGGPSLYDLHSSFAPVDYYFQMLGGHPPAVFFPILPWLVYPLTGLFFGYYLKEYKEIEVFFLAFIAGICLIITAILLPGQQTVTSWLPFYRTDSPGTMLHLGIVLCWIAFVYFFSKYVITKSFFFDVFCWCSRHITVFYITQWIIIAWLLPFVGYQQLSFFPTIIACGAITLTTIVITYLFNLINHGRKHL